MLQHYIKITFYLNGEDSSAESSINIPSKFLINCVQFQYKMFFNVCLHKIYFRYVLVY